MAAPRLRAALIALSPFGATALAGAALAASVHLGTVVWTMPPETAGDGATDTATASGRPSFEATYAALRTLDGEPADSAAAQAHTAPIPVSAARP